jgi:hypothetical protein
VRGSVQGRRSRIPGLRPKGPSDVVVIVIVIVIGNIGSTTTTTTIGG